MIFASDEVKHTYFTLVSAGEQLLFQKMYLDCARIQLHLYVDDVRTKDGKLEIIIRVSS